MGTWLNTQKSVTSWSTGSGDAVPISLSELQWKNKVFYVALLYQFPKMEMIKVHPPDMEAFSWILNTLFPFSFFVYIFLRIVTEIIGHDFESVNWSSVLLFDICIGSSSKFGKVKVTHCLAARPLQKRKLQPSSCYHFPFTVFQWYGNMT